MTVLGDPVESMYIYHRRMLEASFCACSWLSNSSGVLISAKINQEKTPT